ncbi:unnamed protein product [Arctogadus glacialis]
MQLGKTERYPDHPERFDYHRQVLCREGLTGRCYWEVEWEGEVDIGVTYRGITRRGRRDDSLIGQNYMSWCLHGEDAYDVDNVYSSWYNGNKTILPLPPPDHFKRIGVYLHQSAGILSFYRVSPDVGGSSGKRTHIHTFHSTFTQDLYPGFMLYDSDSTVSLCVGCSLSLSLSPSLI